MYIVYRKSANGGKLKALACSPSEPVAIAFAQILADNLLSLHGHQMPLVREKHEDQYFEAILVTSDPLPMIGVSTKDDD